MNDITIHNAKSIRVASVFPKNGNAITLEIVSKNSLGTHVNSMTIFGLDESFTDAILDALSDGDTQEFE